MSSVQTQQLATGANIPSPTVTSSKVSNQLQQKDYSDDKSPSMLATSSSSAQTVSSYCTSTSSSSSSASAATSLTKQSNLTNRGRVKKLSFILCSKTNTLHIYFNLNPIIFIWCHPIFFLDTFQLPLYSYSFCLIFIWSWITNFDSKLKKIYYQPSISIKYQSINSSIKELVSNELLIQYLLSFYLFVCVITSSKI